MGDALRVLIVEDEMLLAMELKYIVEKQGHSVVGVADDAASAAALHAAQRPQLALVDLRLRDGMTGAEIASMLMRAGVPSLLMTSEPRSAPADFGGALGLLAKPYTREDLVDALEYAARRIAGDDSAVPPARGLQLPQMPKP
jgi:DNA-binding LytR/AlgR family response regulator